jgi:hypothetical protein
MVLKAVKFLRMFGGLDGLFSTSGIELEEHAELGGTRIRYFVKMR